MKPRSITSAANNTVKDTARLKRKKHRWANRRFLAEGEDLLEAAVNDGHRPRQVFALEEAVDPAALPGKLVDDPEVEVIAASEAVIGKLSSMGGNSRLVAVFDFLDVPLPGGRDQAGSGMFVYLAGLSDPGNVGALLRSAAALGAEGVILAEDTADPYSPKAVHASSGSIFSIRIHYCPEGIPTLLYWAADLDLQLVGTDQRDGVPAWEADLTGGILLLMGAERCGLPAGLREHAAAFVRVPQEAGIESMNVAMAGTALLYEAARQRATRPGL